MLCVWSVSGQKLEPGSTGKTLEHVIDLKRRLRERYGFPACLQQLLHAGRCLEDSDPLAGLVDLQLVLLYTLSPEKMTQAECEFLEYAVGGGHAEVVRNLLEVGVNKNMYDDKTGDTALMRASSAGHVEIVRLLLDVGAEGVDAALACACSAGHIEILSSRMSILYTCLGGYE